MSKRKTATRSRNLRVLMIDDDTDLASVVVDSLRNAGLDAWAIRPTPSGSIDGMVEAAATFRPDAILVDVVMPTDTAKLVRALRAERRLSRARLFGCSGHAILAGSFSRLLDGFLHKPFSMHELAEMLAEEFGARRPRARAKAKGSGRLKRAGA